MTLTNDISIHQIVYNKHKFITTLHMAEQIPKKKKKKVATRKE